MDYVRASTCCLLILIALTQQPSGAAVHGSVFKDLTTPQGQQIMRSAKSAQMLSFMDTAANPCEDFYGYACGNFARINGATMEEDTSVGQDMFASYLRRVRHLLNQPRMSTDWPMETRVKYFYESCLDTTALRIHQRSQIISVLREFGGMPAVEGDAWTGIDFDPLETMAQLLSRYGKLTLLGVYVAPDYKNSQINRLYLGQRNDLVPIDESSKLAKKLEVQMRLQNLLGLPEGRALKTAEEIVELEGELSRHVQDWSQDRDPRLRNRLTLLSNMTDTYGSVLNMTRFVQTWLGHEYNLPVYESVRSYLSQLKKVLTSTPKRILANYMLSSLLRDYEIPVDERNQKAICSERLTHLMPDVVDHLVYNSLEQQSPHIPNDLSNLWRELKATFQEILGSDDVKWLKQQTQDELLEKLKDITFEITGGKPINFEEQYGALVISSADFFGNVQRLLAVQAAHLKADLMRSSRSENYYDGFILSPFYVTEANLVVLPAMYMQHRYFWDDAYPTALRYGTLGFFLGHEMAHAFDDLNRLYDSHGNLRDSWSRDTKLIFDHDKNCLADQFADLRYSGLKLPKMEAQGENIADNVGIRLAYATYEKWLKLQSKLPDTETLPNMPQTPQQLFYLSVAQSMCTDIHEDRRPAFVRNSVHPPNESRVFVMMANSKSFAEAFQCGNDTKLRPAHRCAMY